MARLGSDPNPALRKRKKAIISIVIIAALFATLFIIWPVSPPPSKPIVVTTTATLRSFLEEIAGEAIEIRTIVPPGFCPGHYDTTPSDVASIEDAELVISHGFEPWLEDLIEASGNERVRRLKVTGTWWIPMNAVKIAQRIRDELINSMPEHESTFSANSKKFVSMIENTFDRLKSEAEDLNVSQINVICMKWQKPFVSFLGFNIIEEYPPPEKITPRMVVELVRLGKSENVSIVVSNLQSGIAFGSELSTEIGAKHVILTGFPGGIIGTGTYIKTLEVNANSLFEAVEAL